MRARRSQPKSQRPSEWRHQELRLGLGLYMPPTWIRSYRCPIGPALLRQFNEVILREHFSLSKLSGPELEKLQPPLEPVIPWINLLDGNY